MDNWFDSSEITIDNESVSSEIPNPALCLKPKCIGNLSLSETGSIHRAAIIFLPWIITAPSCKGPFLLKIDKSNLLDISPD